MTAFTGMLKFMKAATTCASGKQEGERRYRAQQHRKRVGQRDFYDSHISVEVDAYYKLLRDLATYREGYSTLIGDSDWRSKVEADGKGKSYGLELIIRFNFNRLDGYLGYISRTPRGSSTTSTTAGNTSMNTTAPIPSIQLTERWSLSALWTYQTGLPYTPVIGEQLRPIVTPEGGVHFEETDIYGERNSDRMRDYHRLDSAAKPNGLSRFTTSIAAKTLIITYNDKKGDPISWQQFPDNPQQLWQWSFFPIIPTFSYKVWF